MHIITLMNYDDPRGVEMCKIWLYLAKRFNPMARITIFHGEKGDSIRRYATYFRNVRLVPLDTRGLLSWKESQGFAHPPQEFILGIWKHFEDVRKPLKHLYVEADAWILSPLDDWWRVADGKPYIAVEERVLETGHVLINTGAYSYCSRDNFISYSKLLQQFRDDGCRILIPVGEQGLTNAYLRRIGYDCRHPDIGFEYNCWAVNCKIERMDAGGIVVRSGDRPQGGKDRGLNWGWWDRNSVAKILHAFFIKYWELPECQALWDYCLTEAEKIERRGAVDGEQLA